MNEASDRAYKPAMISRDCAELPGRAFVQDARSTSRSIPLRLASLAFSCTTTGRANEALGIGIVFSIHNVRRNRGHGPEKKIESESISFNSTTLGTNRLTAPDNLPRKIC
jgi:hypothetical protein